MLRLIILGMVLIAIMFIIWVAWAEIQAFRSARERDRHDRMGG